MVKDTLNSMLDNIKERTTNPFLGTFVIVWIVKNWKLVYSLFYFDSAFTLPKRLAYIERYFNEKSFWCNMLVVVGFTILVLVITYILLALSRLLTEFYDKMVVPKIAKITDKSSIVLKSKYNELEEAFKLLEKRYEEERLAKVAAQNERDTSDTKLLEYMSKPSESTELESIPSSVPASFTRVSNKARQTWTPEKFNNFLTNITNGALMNTSDEIMKVLLRENFITPAGRSATTGKDYKLTDEGMAFLKYWNNMADDTSNSGE
ncbi:hypothetical protein [Pedobacter miscanthi]|uniref:Uncharacterized protein n=1 Tax=Pedobacter miscanthi TaxID=2259170 RepID=A0A366KW33_9SPHI|nr:hypothetical protein [Pedobacter miscanthi]RBQ05847.1 hypothetical protein DRW42_15220 [Pedobacter miscanthi]